MHKCQMQMLKCKYHIANSSTHLQFGHKLLQEFVLRRQCEVTSKGLRCGGAPNPADQHSASSCRHLVWIRTECACLHKLKLIAHKQVNLVIIGIGIGIGICIDIGIGIGIGICVWCSVVFVGLSTIQVCRVGKNPGEEGKSFGISSCNCKLQSAMAVAIWLLSCQILNVDCCICCLLLFHPYHGQRTVVVESHSTWDVPEWHELATRAIGLSSKCKTQRQCQMQMPDFE